MSFPFVTLAFSLNPTSEELRKGREVMSLLRSMSANAERAPNAEDDDDLPIITAPEIAASLRAPVPPPPPPADTALQSVVPPPVGHTVAPTHDATGLPWDERIHSGNRTQNQDGSWKKRKGAGDDYVKMVEGELRGAPSAPPAPTSAPVPAPPAPPPPPMAPTGTNEAYLALIKRFSDGTRDKKWPPTISLDMAKLASRGVTPYSLINLNADSITNPTLLPAVSHFLDLVESGLDTASASANAAALIG